MATSSQNAGTKVRASKIRPASSYRGARRNEHRTLPMPEGVARPRWDQFNIRGPFQIGGVVHGHRITTVSHKVVGILAATGKRLIGGFGTRAQYSRSKYMPHIGDKERARHAGKHDGVVHGQPPIHALNASVITFAKAPKKGSTVSVTHTVDTGGEPSDVKVSVKRATKATTKLAEGFDRAADAAKNLGEATDGLAEAVKKARKPRAKKVAAA